MLSQERLTASPECERAWVEIDLEALTHNAQQIQRLLRPTTDLMAVIKADAYGHGAVTVANTLLECGVTTFGVATVPEGVELRENGINGPILVLGAVNTPAQVQLMAQWRLMPTLSSAKQALTFSETLNQPLPVHVMLDTGMSRQGCPWMDGAELIEFVHRLPKLTLAGILPPPMPSIKHFKPY
jgi:alanine racemase